MTEEQLQQIEAAERAATPGGWYVVGPPWGDGSYIVAGHEDPHLGKPICDTIPQEDFEEGEEEYNFQADMDFIAGARAWVPQLLAEVRRLNEMLIEAHAVQGDLENQLEGLRQQQRQEMHDEQEEHA